MSASDNIRDRISVRAFQDKEVDKDIIAQVIDVARWAPSGTNTQ
ncbi:MAG: nitroreductase family protein, partial [Verrucomicrobiota bacterium]